MWLAAPVILVPLQGWGAPQSAPFRLRCLVEGDSPLHLRVDPRRQQLEILDARFETVLQSITTSTPPPELGGGIIDESRVAISSRDIVWEETMYRPQFVRERHRIDRASLTYRIEETIQIDTGPEMAERVRTGACQAVAGAGTATPPGR